MKRSTERLLFAVLAVAALSLAAASPRPTGFLSTTSATLDFPLTAAGLCSNLTVSSVSDAYGGYAVVLGKPAASVPAGGNFDAWVSADNEVTVRFCADTLARNPASGSFNLIIVEP